MRRSAVLTGLALVVAACGADVGERRDGTKQAAVPTPTTKSATTETRNSRQRPRRPPLETRCAAADLPGYRKCLRSRGVFPLRATIERREAGGWRVVTREPRGALGRRHVSGEWGTLSLSPDGTTILAEWLVECDSALTFFVPADGGPPRATTGEKDWRRAPISRPHGWSSDGRARIWIFDGGCGPAHPQPGRYLVDPVSGELDRVGPLP